MVSYFVPYHSRCSNYGEMVKWINDGGQDDFRNFFYKDYHHYCYHHYLNVNLKLYSYYTVLDVIFFYLNPHYSSSNAVTRYSYSYRYITRIELAKRQIIDRSILLLIFWSAIYQPQICQTTNNSLIIQYDN